MREAHTKILIFDFLILILSEYHTQYDTNERRLSLAFTVDPLRK